MGKDDLNGLSDSLGNWNPMEDAYRNEKFNAYRHGPGANLDPSLQINNANKNLKNNKNKSSKAQQNLPFLYITKVPNSMNEHMMKIICERHGRILQVRKNPRSHNFFVDCETVSDMESISRALSRNDYGFCVNIGKHKKNDNDEQTTQYNDTPHSGEYKSGPRTENRMPESVEKIFAEFKKKEGNVNTASEPEFLNKCTFCGVCCFLTCARCKTYYCSVECQAKDWGTHRATCGKPPHIKYKDGTQSDSESLSSSPSSKVTENKNISENQDSQEGKTVYTKGYPLSGSMVVLTGIAKSNLVFIRSKTYENDIEYLSILTKVQNAGKKLKPIKDKPRTGKIVLTVFESKINRALILGEKNNGSYRVSYIDHGSVDEKPFKELYEADDEITALSILVKPVILKNVPECFLSNDIRSFMYSYLDADPLKIQYKEADFIEEKAVFAVQLFDEVTNRSFNEAVLKLCKPVQPIENDVFYETELEKVDLPRGENIELIVMDNSMLNIGIIACTTKECAAQITKFQQQIDDYIKSLKTKTMYAPRLNELCIAQYNVDKKWYRGVCLELAGDGYPTILFLDYGNMDMVDIKYIRPYPRQLDMPVFTRECLVRGLPSNCESNLVKRAEELIPCCSFIKCDKVEKDEQGTVHYVTLNKAIQTLIDEKLLIPGAEEDESLDF